MAATAVRRVANVQELDDDAAAEGLIDPNDVALETMIPGNVIYDMGDGTKEGQNEFTYVGDNPNDFVFIYDIDGRSWSMPREWALLRLQKRYPANHHLYPNMRVFYRRAPKEFPEPTLPCLSTWKGGCPKKFHTKRNQEAHFRNRHREEFREYEESQRRDREERSIAAQERQADLMAALLAKLAGGETVPQSEVNQALAGAVATSEPAPGSEPVVAWDVTKKPDETTTVNQMREWLKFHELPMPPRNGVGMQRGEWLDYCLAVKPE